MIKEIELVSEYHGLTIVWVDDRVLLSESERSDLEATGLNSELITGMDSTWAAAVLGNNIDSLAEIAEQLAFAKVALKMILVCRELKCNLVMVDFRTAHKKWFKQDYALFLLDVQNITKILGSTTLDNGDTDENWNWELYGAHCVRAYDFPKSRFRFCSRFRDAISQQIAELLPNLFERDFRKVEDVAFKHNLPEVLQRHFKEFVENNMVHPDPKIAELLLWFLDLPLTMDTSSNHDSLGKGDALNRCRNEFNANFAGESAKALFLGADQWQLKIRQDHNPLTVSDFLAVLNHLGLVVTQEGTWVNDKLKLPCLPALPLVLGLKALIHEMGKCDTYSPPCGITLYREASKTSPDDKLLEYSYRLSLLLEDRDKRSQPINMDKFGKSYDDWVSAGRTRDAQHQTRQRIGDLEFCKLDVKAIPRLAEKPQLLSGTTAAAFEVGFNPKPPRVDFKWKADA